MIPIKVPLFALLFFVFSFECVSQEILWQKTLGGSAGDGLNIISSTSDGGYICCGGSFSNTSGIKSENCYGGEDFWMVKLSSIGELQWENTIGGTLEDRPFAAIETPDGGFLIGGYSESDSSGEKTENSKGGLDIWIVKLSSNGTLEWQKTIGGSSDDLLVDMKPTSDGGYILASCSLSMISGDKTENSYGGGDYWIVKIDSLANIQWQKVIGGSAAESTASIIIMPDGGFVVGGYSNSPVSGNKTEVCLGLYDYYIVRLDSMGNIIWQKAIGGLKMDLLRELSLAPDGGIICGGVSQSDSSQYKSENNLSSFSGDNDYWVVKLDSSGIISWENTLGGEYSDHLMTLNCLPSGEIVCGGYGIFVISGDQTENPIGSGDIWLLKLSPDGKIIYQNLIGGIGGEGINSVIPTLDGNIICGSSSSSNISGDKTENSYGLGDYWVFKISDQHNTIRGKVFMDLDQDNIFGPMDLGLKNRNIAEVSTGVIGFTDADGEYFISVPDSGNYEVSTGIYNGYFAPVPSSHNVYFPGNQQTIAGNDFAMQATSSFDDLCLTITPTGPFRSGFNTSCLIDYSNLGTTTINATVVFYIDSNVSFISSSLSPTSIFLDSVVFSIGNLTPFQTGQILVTINVNIGLPIGSLIISGATILPVLGDANPACNTAFFETLTIGSYDPNDILVNRNFIYDFETQNPPELEYTIRFQNTGNDTAFTVKILDPIDTTRLDLNSLEIVASSHPMNAFWIPWERNMQFQFNNILLADSSTNEPQSHGFIRYKIKPKPNLPVGDSISNKAYIYFDFNNPIATNIATTNIVLFTGNHEPENLFKFDIYPNPVSTHLNIEFKHSFPNTLSLELFSVYGQKIQTIECKNSTETNFINTFNISHLAAGIYFLRPAGNTSIMKKFVKY